MMVSECCGATAHYISEEMCSECLEWSEFYDEEE